MPLAEPIDYRLLLAVQSAIQAADGSAPYHLTLSTSGRVVLGLRRPDDPPAQGTSCVAVSLGPTDTNDGPDLPGTSNSFTLYLQGWAPGTEDTADGRMLAISRLRADIVRALRAARSAGSTSLLNDMHLFRVSVTTADARQLGLSLPCGYLEGEITCEYPVEYGEAE